MPAVLSLLVRVQVVQHGLGAAQAAYLHRGQLAVLPRLRAAVGCAHPDTAVLYYKVGVALE